jgi:hypothetical protein
VATTKPLDLILVRPSFFQILSLFGVAFLVFGTTNAITAQEQQLTSNLTSGAKSVVPAPEKSRSELERELLLPLLLQERELLTRCGRDHPELKAIRGRIAGVRDYLATLTAPPSEPFPVAKPTTRLTNPESHKWTTANPSSLPTAIDQPRLSSKPTGLELSLTGYSAPSKFQPHASEESSSLSSVMSFGSSSPAPNKVGEKSPGETFAAEPLRSTSSKLETGPGTHVSDGMALPKPIASEKKLAASILEQQFSSPDVAKTMLGKEKLGPSGYFLQISGRQFLVFFGALLVCLFAHLAAFCLILRLYVSQPSPPPHQQLVHQHSDVPAPDDSPTECSSSGIQRFPLAIGGFDLEKPPFDVSAVASLESTWTEELQNKEKEEMRQGQAIFQQLFKANMELKNQLIAAGEAS